MRGGTDGPSAGEEVSGPARTSTHINTVEETPESRLARGSRRNALSEKPKCLGTNLDPARNLPCEGGCSHVWKCSHLGGSLDGGSIVHDFNDGYSELGDWRI